MNNQALDLYIKTKKDWDTKASVRTTHHTYDLDLDGDKKNSYNWHVPTYSAILQHEQLKSLSDLNKKFIMGTQLLEFVEKTTKFEVDYVNKVANNFALNKYKFDLPEILKLDALKIYTDEGFHAHVSQKMSDQIKSYYNIKDDLNPYLKSFFEKVDNIGSKFEKKYKYLANISAVIVSEAMIVQDMSSEMKKVVHEPIRDMLRDHMIDEIFHANYFSTLFKIIWPQMKDLEKEIMGHNLCESMIIFGAPRVDIYYYSFSKLGFDRNEISKFIKDTYDTKIWKIDKVKKRMTQTLNLLKSCGVFEIPSVKEEFSNKNLI